ncbi:hypothetical protein KC867_03460, partial [Candidatus Saccharibacteria bacterium]|nr:hypothetical protein [Candidatus Saccharibacteria bacterium]
ETTPAPVDNSACEVTTAPNLVEAGQRFDATIKLKNTGDTNWDPNDGYIIGSQDPADNMNWGTNRVRIGNTITSGTSKEINQSFTAPSSPGTYQFSWQMLKGTTWFGSSCTSPIQVKTPPTPVEEVDACPNIPGFQSSSSECSPCEESTSDDDVQSCLIIAKTASNITQSITDANNTTAKASDEIRYTLSVTNSSKVTMTNFVFEEILVDVLEYADINEVLDASINEASKTLQWAPVDIESGQTVTKTFTVKVKDIIPQTPVSASDPTSYDLVMTNTFHGVTINIKLPPSISKTTETVITTLPSTGPGTSIVIGFTLTTVVAYFFARSRLLNQELEIIRADFAQTGGV